MRLQPHEVRFIIDNPNLTEGSLCKLINATSRQISYIKNKHFNGVKWSHRGCGVPYIYVKDDFYQVRNAKGEKIYTKDFGTALLMVETLIKSRESGVKNVTITPRIYGDFGYQLPKLMVVNRSSDFKEREHHE